MKNDPIQLSPLLLTAVFLDVKAGQEHDVRHHLPLPAHRHVFEALGTFDVVGIAEVQSLEHPWNYSSTPQARSSCSVTGYLLDDPAYSSPSPHKFIDKNKLAALIFIEVNRQDIKSEHPFELQRFIELAPKLEALANKSGLTIGLYGGMGRSDIYAVVQAEQLDQIWDFVQKIRSLKSGGEIEDGGALLLSTHTIPLINFDLFKYNHDGKVEDVGVGGETEAAISITCPPGYESELKKHFSEDDYSIYNLLGDDDALIVTKRKIPTAGVIKTVSNFRVECKTIGDVYLNTSTLIASNTRIANSTNWNFKAEENKIIDQVAEKVMRLRNERLANRLQKLVYRINELKNDPALSQAIGSIGNYPNYLNALIANLRPDENKDEGLLMNAIDSAELAISQRTETRFGNIRASYAMPITFGDGIRIPVSAVEKLITFIIDTWCEHNKGFALPWEGFAVYSDSHGFQLREGEIFYLPTAALYDCQSPIANWLTLTHEISHAIFLRLNVWVEIENLANFLIDKYQENEEITRFLRKDQLPDIVNELFAHWYDFYHFYDADIKKYLEMIWRSWIELPLVSKNFAAYYYRSFLIFLCSNRDDIYKLRHEELAEFSQKKWKEHADFFKQIPSIERKLPGDMVTVLQNEEKFIKHAMVHSFIILEFYASFLNDDFRTAINASFPEIDNYYSSLSSGKVIPKSPSNPYCLLKRLVEGNLSSSRISPVVSSIPFFLTLV